MKVKEKIGYGKRKIAVGLVLAILLCLMGNVAHVAGADNGTNMWTGAGETDLWHDPANWTAGIPQAGQDVRIDSAPNVRLTGATATLGSFFLDAGRTLTVEGWDSALEATELTIAGTIRHAAQTATEPDPGTGEWVPDHRILLTGQDITIAATGHLNADAMGYQGGYGPGAGVTSRGGGGYGGAGSPATGDGHIRGEAYGEADEPWQPGSGGGTSGEDVNGAGGGAVRIHATGAVTVDGMITLNGQNGSGTSRPGGSGGGVWITCHTFHGPETGVIQAHGGNGTTRAGDGGGGRIAIHYNPAAQAALAKPVPDMMFSIRPGTRDITLYPQEMGTLYLPDTLFLNIPLDAQRFWHTHLVVEDLTQWTTPELLLDNCIVWFPEGFELGVDGDLILRNGARLGMHAAPTNAISGEFGARLDVGGNIQLENDSWLDVFAHPTNGAVVALYSAGDVTIDANSGIDAAGRGFRHFYGPGRGASGYAAGSYGGLGGRNPGPIYGCPVFAVDPGSCGGTRIRGDGPVSGFGGGAIRLMVGGNLHVDGTVTADGGSGVSHGGGGGSGGSVFIACQRITGTGTVRANGGPQGHSTGGQGGGGRVAVWYRMPLSRVEQHLASRDKSGFTVHEQQPSSFAGTVEADALQTGDYPGEHGTVRFCTLTGTLLMMR